MKSAVFADEFVRSGVVLVVRLGSSNHLEQVAQAATGAGVRFMEVTSNTPGGLDWIRENGAQFDDLVFGVGTVTDAAIADAALDAGAEFLVAPHVDAQAIRSAEARGVAYIPGALTPTEVLEATRAGAPAVKLFPVTQLGSGYVRDLLGPFPEAPLVPIGGITEENAATFIEAGAVGVGVGAAFVSDAIVGAADWDRMQDRLARLVGEVANATSKRSGSG